jgi:hypothetical protein
MWQARTAFNGKAFSACALIVVALATGCSSADRTDHTPTTSTTSTTSTPGGHNTHTGSGLGSRGSSDPSTSTPPPVTTPASLDLSGTWTGRYGGAFSGTFRLSWQQAASRLSGTITLSTEPGALRLTGSVHGATITFGTVGSAAITYSGTASDDSMSGSYRISGTSGGNWSATKTI